MVVADDEVEADRDSVECVEFGDDGGESHDRDEGNGESPGAVFTYNTKTWLLHA